jgi:cobalt/nickel transport system ATP-binding protein
MIGCLALGVADATGVRLVDITYRAAAGSKVALLGGNGAGKSTLLHVLAGTCAPTSGHVTYDGDIVAEPRATSTSWTRRVQLVVQDPAEQLFAASLYDDVAFGPRAAGLDRDSCHARTTAALAAVALCGLEARPVHALSRGEQQRAAIAGVDAVRPEVLLLDEPMSALDAVGRSHVEALFSAWSARGTTIVVATHDADWALEWADEVLVLAHGRVVAAGPPLRTLASATLWEEACVSAPSALVVDEALRARGLIPASHPRPRTLRDALGSVPSLATGVPCR